MLNVLITAIAKDSGCPLLFHAWYLDDGALAGTGSSLCSVLKLIQELGLSLGLHINISKCEVISCKGLSSFPPEMKQSSEPNLDILRVPIGTADFCSAFSLKNIARLSLSRGGLGLCSLAQHSPAAYIASLCTSGFGPQSQHDFVSATQMFNSFLPPSDAINAEVLLLIPVTQKSLSSKLDDYLFKVLLDMSSIADKARLLSVSSPHAGS